MMALIVRAIIRGNGEKICISNKNIFNFSFNVIIPNNRSSSYCGHEIFLNQNKFFARKYSIQSSSTISEVTTNKKNGKETIYKGFLAPNIRRLKILSLGTSMVGIGMQPMLYSKVVTDGTVTPMTLPLFGCIALLALVTPPLLNLITKRYVVSIEYDSENDKYTAVVYNLFALKRKIEFTPEDVTIPTVLGMFTNCAIKGNPVFLDAKFFSEQYHYIRIMGYDKPINLHIDNEEDCSKKKSD